MQETYWLLIATDGTASVVGYGSEPPEIVPQGLARLEPAVLVPMMPLVAKKLAERLEVMANDSLEEACKSRSEDSAILAGRADGLVIAAGLLTGLYSSPGVKEALRWAERTKRYVQLTETCERFRGQLPPEVEAALKLCT